MTYIVGVNEFIKTERFNGVYEKLGGTITFYFIPKFWCLTKPKFKSFSLKIFLNQSSVNRIQLF